uniref:Small ribosomal subunit protein uS10 domain-containing protein n=1 Tax=Leersia perrieri TaxID=77586 RepID=A0A0D9WQZ2_9ORYZ
MAAKIRIIMKSFMSQANKVQGVIPYEQKIGLPESRSLYTVLRSPHIDKKSREQFSMHVKKQFLVQKAETHELQKKLFWLKRLRLLGAQYEIQINFKTRLDKSKLQAAFCSCNLYLILAVQAPFDTASIPWVEWS